MKSSRKTCRDEPKRELKRQLFPIDRWSRDEFRDALSWKRVLLFPDADSLRAAVSRAKIGVPPTRKVQTIFSFRFTKSSA
ncbi:hypothetical protein TNCV_405931 [Trichonephila clavipes]|nr:hypothetical protein TNCV_405931 [Trichonephila clavipes]